MADRSLTPEQEDHCLVKAAHNDLSRFSALYERYFKRVYYYVASRIGDQTVAEDLTSRIFLKCLENLTTFQFRGSFAAWLFTIARNTVISHCRNDRREYTLEEPPNTTLDKDPIASHIAHNEELAYLNRLLAQMDESALELLRLRYAGGLTYPEMAEVLGRSEGAVKMATHRLLKRLQQEMEKAQ